MTLSQSFDPKVMIKATMVLVLCGFFTFAQKTLILQPNQVGRIRSKVDQLTLDSLVMLDSSMLIFSGHKTMYLQVNHLIVGNGCVLAGSGEKGRNGDMPAYTGAYTRNSPYITGERGWNGRNGTNLIITVKDLVIKDTFTIFVPGGNGGNGSIAPSLNVFSYNGRSGLGGNGGQGGDVMIVCPRTIEEGLDRILVVNHGGRAGTMGDINPYSLIPFPFSPIDKQALLNNFRYARQIERDGLPGKVSLMKLQ